MDKIKMTTPLVEMDGDEMTRILWKRSKRNLWYKPQTVLNESAITGRQAAHRGRLRLWRRQQPAGGSLCAGALGCQDQPPRPTRKMKIG